MAPKPNQFYLCFVGQTWSLLWKTIYIWVPSYRTCSFQFTHILYYYLAFHSIIYSTASMLPALLLEIFEFAVPRYRLSWWKSGPSPILGSTVCTVCTKANRCELWMCVWNGDVIETGLYKAKDYWWNYKNE